MASFPWKDLLTRWSAEIIGSGDYEDQLTPEVTASGWLGDRGATEEEILAAEARLGVTFPPSYRQFLQVSDGWRMTTSFVRRLRPVSELQWFAAEEQETIDAWLAGGGDCPVSDEEYLVYRDTAVQPLRAEYLQTALAVSDYGDGIYLLNPQTITPEGEWEAWFFAPWIPGADRYRSFWELMAAEHEHFLYALKSSRGEPTPHADASLGIAAEDFGGLVAALQDPAHRPAALQALGNLRDKGAFEPVLQVFQDRDADLFSRECAARTLGELRDPRAVGPLIDAFRVAPGEMNDLQLTALLRSRMGLPGDATLAHMLGTVSIQDMIDALDPLLGTGMTGHLQATLTPETVSRGVSERLNYACMQGLLTMGTVALPGLLQALQDPDPGVRRQVASTLCHARSNDQVLEALVGALDDPEPSVRAAIAASIERLFDHRAVDPLFQALEDVDSTVRTHAVRSLGIMASRSDAERIAEALAGARERDPDAGVRRAAAQGLERLGRG